MRPLPFHLNAADAPLVCGLIAACISFSCAPAQAQTTYTWVGGNSGNWNTPSRWSPSGNPASNDTIFLGNGPTGNATIGLNGNRAVGTITMNATNFDYIFSGNPGGTLNMSVSSGTPTISVISSNRTLFVDSNNGIAGTQGFVKTGNGTLAIAGNGTYTGGTTISAGTIRVGAAAAIGNASNSLTVNGGTLDLNGFSVSVGNLTGTGGTITSASTTNRTLTIGTGNGTGGNYQGIIQNGSGTTALTKVGTGSITLSGSNTYTGATRIRNGSLIAGTSSLSGSAGAFGNSTSAIVLGTSNTETGGTPALLIGGAFTVGRAITVGSETNNATYSAILGGSNSSGTSTFSGAITLGTTASAYTPLLQAATGGTVDFTGTWTTNNKAITVGSSGNTGTVRLSSTLTTTSNVTVSFGTLQIGNGGTAGLITGTSNLIDNAALVYDRSDTITAGYTISGTGSLTKRGGGSLSLTAANTYGGGTTVSAGTLLANNSSGSATGSGAVVVNSGATFGGNGSIAGALAINAGGTLAPGNSIADLASGANTWNGSMNFEFEFDTDGTGLAGTNWDVLNVTGSLDLTGATNLDQVIFKLFTMSDTTTRNPLVSWDPDANHTWEGFVTTTTGFVAFDAGKFLINTAGFQNTINGSFSIVQNGNNLDLVYVAVPEPPLLALLAGSGIVGMALSRTRSVRRPA